MEKLIDYRETSYFNNTDQFLFKNNYNKWFVSKVHYHNGAWFTNENLKYKAITVKCLNLENE